MPDVKHAGSRAQAPAGGGRQRGFTLIETSIALTVLLVAGLSAAQLYTYAITYNTGANDRALAQTVAQDQMEQLRKTSFDQIASSTQTVTTAGRPFKVVTTVCNDGSAACGRSTAVKMVTLSVTPQAAGPSWARSSVVLVSFYGAPRSGDYFQ